MRIEYKNAMIKCRTLYSKISIIYLNLLKALVYTGFSVKNNNRVNVSNLDHFALSLYV